MTEGRRLALIRYRAAHLENIRERGREWYRSHRGQARQYYATNRNQILIRVKNAHQINPVPGRLRAKAHYQANRASKLDYQRQHQLQNPERVRTYKATYRQNNPAKLAFYARQRRALQARVAIDPRGIDAWWATIIASDAVACYYCKSVTAGKLMHMDHVIPLKLGGPHAIGNCCAACPACNWSKNATLPSDWSKMPQRFLSL